MSKCLTKRERNFNVCSDCIYFLKYGIIDDRYPELVYGTCNKHDELGLIDNRWETSCRDCTVNASCKNCKFCRGDFCDYYNQPIEDCLNLFAGLYKNICDNFIKIE